MPWWPSTHSGSKKNRHSGRRILTSRSFSCRPEDGWERVFNTPWNWLTGWYKYMFLLSPWKLIFFFLSYDPIVIFCLMFDVYLFLNFIKERAVIVTFLRDGSSSESFSYERTRRERKFYCSKDTYRLNGIIFTHYNRWKVNFIQLFFRLHLLDPCQTFRNDLYR